MKALSFGTPSPSPNHRTAVTRNHQLLDPARPETKTTFCVQGVLVLLRPSCDDHEVVVRERSLEPERLQSRRTHPNVDLLRGRENDRHRLRVECSDQRVWLGREESEDVVRRLPFLDLSSRCPTCPDAGKEGEGPRLIEGEPDWRTRPVGQHLVLRKT